MGMLTGIKANKAYRAQQKGDTAETIRLYEECFNEGLNDPRFILSYAVLIIRDGQYQKAKDFLVKHQKAPGMSDEQRVNLIVDYAACVYRLGDLDKAILKLEEIQRSKGVRSLIYQTLGYLYVEKYQEGNREAFLRAERDRAATAAAAIPADENAGAAEGAPAPGPDPEAENGMTPEEAWEAGKEMALKFNQDAVAYDDEDAVCLDNLGQTYYRVLGDKAAAREWFEKAIAQKEGQIDTLYFLSRYDLEAGDKAAAREKLEKAAEGRFSPLNYVTKEAIEAEIAALR